MRGVAGSGKLVFMGDWSHKQVGDGRLAPKTGGSLRPFSNYLEFGKGLKNR